MRNQKKGIYCLRRQVAHKPLSDMRLNAIFTCQITGRSDMRPCADLLKCRWVDRDGTASIMKVNTALDVAEGFRIKTPDTRLFKTCIVSITYVAGSPLYSLALKPISNQFPDLQTRYTGIYEKQDGYSKVFRSLTP